MARPSSHHHNSHTHRAALPARPAKNKDKDKDKDKNEDKIRHNDGQKDNTSSIPSVLKTDPVAQAQARKLASTYSPSIQALQALMVPIISRPCRKCGGPNMFRTEQARGQSRQGVSVSTATFILAWSQAAADPKNKEVYICGLKCPSSLPPSSTMGREKGRGEIRREEDDGPRCSGQTCVGCGDYPDAGENGERVKPVKVVQGNREVVYTLRWCCMNGSMFGIWALLGKYDEMVLELRRLAERKEADKKIGAEAMKNMNNNMVLPGRGRLGEFGPLGGRIGWSAAGGGIGEVTQPKGVGYDDGMDVFSHGFESLYDDSMWGPIKMRKAIPQAVKFKNQDAQTDFAVRMILTLVDILLPSSSATNLSPGLRGMIEVSLILDKVAELFRNDSIDNVEERWEVYGAAMRFTMKLVRNPELASLVTEERKSKKMTKGLQAITEAGTEGKKLEEVLVYGTETTSSIATCLENLARQAKIVLSSIRSKDQRQGMFALCQDIVHLQREIVEQMQPEAKKQQESKTADELWANYHKEKCLDRQKGITNYLHPRFQMEAMRPMHVAMGRTKRLFTEQANMATSLPLGVFVKVDDSRPDILKALIMGPKDSPYGFGLFEFDFFCPAQYPQVPPLVTAAFGCAAGAANINPNIHPDGKVCLSLLNTWNSGDSAARWQPNVSTLLQVMITLQAMIFCEDPWRNEPGNNVMGGSPQAVQAAHQYRLRRQPMTIKYAMIDWMARLRQGHAGIWTDIVKNHFRINKDSILTNVLKWARENREIQQWQGWYGSGPQKISGFPHATTVDLYSSLKRELDSLSSRAKNIK